jgi:hypothetical protein
MMSRFFLGIRYSVFNVQVLRVSTLKTKQSFFCSVFP